MKFTALMVVAGLQLVGLAPGHAASAAPQPRVRLERLPGGGVARVEHAAPTDSAAKAVVMERLVVAGNKLPATPRREEPEPQQFSVQRGGPVYSGKVGEFPIEIGLWAARDFLPDGARFKPQKTRVDFEVVRVKL